MLADFVSITYFSVLLREDSDYFSTVSILPDVSDFYIFLFLCVR